MKQTARIIRNNVPYTLLSNGVLYGEPVHVPSVGAARGLPNPPPAAIHIGSAGQSVTGTYYWDADSTDTDDGQTVIEIDSVATGRYKPVSIISGGGGGTGLSVANVAALKAVLSTTLTDTQPATVQTPGTNWVWSASTGAGFESDDITVIRPNNVLLGSNGRWYNTASSPVVPTIAALRLAVSGRQPSISVQAYSTLGDGAGGIFDYDSGDTTTADNDGTIIVAGTRRYKRRFSGPIDARWFGVKLTTAVELYDSQPALMNALATGQEVFLYDSGDYDLFYYCSETIEIDSGRIRLSGQSGGSIWDGFTNIHFPEGVDGVRILDGASAGSVFKNIRLKGPNSGSYAQGFTINVRSDFENVEVLNFQGSGVEIYGAGGSSNCNSCSIRNLNIIACGRLTDVSHPVGSDGFHIRGLDSNACAIIGLRVSGSGRYNIHDNSFLGNSYFMPESDNAGRSRALPGDPIVGYYIDGAVNATSIWGPYTEGERVFLGPCAMMVGGPVGTSYLMPGSSGCWLNGLGNYGTNLRLQTQSGADPQAAPTVVTSYAPTDEPAIFYWQKPSDFGTRTFSLRKVSTSSAVSGMYFARVQTGLTQANAFGITDADFYRGSGLCHIPTAYYLGTGAAAKRHWQGLRNDAHGITLEIGDSFQYASVSAGGFMGEVVTRAGVWARNWAANTTYVDGDLVTPTTDNAHYYRCTTPGTSDLTTEPTWNTGSGSTTGDNGIVWTEYGTSALFKTYGAISA